MYIILALLRKRQFIERHFGQKSSRCRNINKSLPKVMFLLVSDIVNTKKDNLSMIKKECH